MRDHRVRLRAAIPSPRALTAVILAGLLGCAAPCRASAGEVVTSTTKGEVDIGLMYDGEFIYFFGSVPVPGADVIVKLTSTDDAAIVVNRKGRVGLFWMNATQFKVKGLPLLYKIHSTRSLAQVLRPELAARLGVGYDVLKRAMKLEVARGEGQPDDRDLVFDGVLRLKREANLYNIDEKRIEVTGGKLFKHTFRFPSAAKEGVYTAESFVIKDGRLIGKGIDRIVIKKTGLEAAFTSLAHEHEVLYGLTAIGVALVMGLLVGFIFKKGGGH
jgi:uncharacterized protein (TIGR02186 family)